MRHGAPIELVQELVNRLVELSQEEEGLMAQPCQDPALHHLDGDLDLSFVPRVAHAGRNHREAVVLGQRLVGRVEVRLIETGMLHPAFEVVWGHD